MSCIFSPHLTELREEDSPDKANEYIEKCIGTTEPLVKVRKGERELAHAHESWDILLITSPHVILLTYVLMPHMYFA